MPRRIEAPTIVEAVGTPPKRIEEYAGRVNTGSADASVARMVSPEGWREPGQSPEFQEITVVLKGLLRVEHKGGQVLGARQVEPSPAGPPLELVRLDQADAGVPVPGRNEPMRRVDPLIEVEGTEGRLLRRDALGLFGRI